MNKSILALIFVLGGAALLYVGYQRRQSVAGAAESLGKNIANKVDGGARLPEHTWYFVGGGALIVVGAMIAARK